ncbi:FAD-dependent monooxygenase [Deinococcus lacus]|uniref:FAD-dependent monooxygenase n=1 Tax=Deinococcus lacus TaxID=392561 RepID=A0ABW1Y8P3_9DEIO
MEIAVVGGGIGGLAVTRALQMQGHAVTVYEAEPELRSLGGGLIVPPNSVRVLRELGLGHFLETETVRLRDMQILDASGKLVYRRDQRAVANALGQSLLAVSRSRLHAALAQIVGVGTIEAGRRLVQLDNTFNEVTAHFADGSRARADLLIAADGRLSTVRSLLFPQTRLVGVGQIAYRGVAPLELGGDWQHSFAELWGSGRRFTFFPWSRG